MSWITVNNDFCFTKSLALRKFTRQGSPQGSPLSLIRKALSLMGKRHLRNLASADCAISPSPHILAMPVTADITLQEQFRTLAAPAGKKVNRFTSFIDRLALILLQFPIRQCRHCKTWKLAKNITKIKNHLAECGEYLKKQREFARKHGNLH
jgi:hypothetical protein